MGLLSNLQETAIQRVFGTALREAEARLTDASVKYENIMERLVDAELALDSMGWDLITSLSSSDDISRHNLLKTVSLLRSMSFLNPIMKQGIGVTGHYTLALGFTVEHPDKTIEDKIDALINDPRNQTAIFGPEARQELERELMCSGNIFLVVLPGVIPDVRRFVIDEITEIIPDPDDVGMKMLYERTYTRQVFDVSTGRMQEESAVEYYFDAEYRGVHRDLTTMRGHEIKPGLMIHVTALKVGRMLFGVPEALASSNWAKAYKEFLQDWIKILAGHAQLIWKAKNKTRKGVEATKQNLKTNITTSDPVERTNIRSVGGVANMTTSAEMEPMRTANAAESPESARRVHLMTVAGFGLPETAWGDIQVGSEATSTNLDRPTELYITLRQDRWKAAFVAVFCAGLRIDSTDRQRIQMKMPEIVGRPIRDVVSAIVDAATLKGLPLNGTGDIKTFSKLLMQQLRVPDGDAIIDAIYPESEYDPRDFAIKSLEDQRSMASLQQQGPDDGDENTPSSKTQQRSPRTPKPGRTRPNDSGPRG